MLLLENERILMWTVRFEYGRFGWDLVGVVGEMECASNPVFAWL
jgi:hypothetical protein